MIAPITLAHGGERMDHMNTFRQGIDALAHSPPTVARRGWGLAFVVAVFILMLGLGPSWGGPPNPTESDDQGNTAGGSFALESNEGGRFNTAFGDRALTSNTIGADNTAAGASALGRNTTGTFNIAIGVVAGEHIRSGSNNIYLGHGGETATESDTMRLGQSQTRTFISGITGVPVSGTPVRINSRGQLGIQPSSARYKRDIQEMGSRSQGLLHLRPVTFRYQHDPQGLRQYGLIAEEVV